MLPGQGSNVLVVYMYTAPPGSCSSDTSDRISIQLTRVRVKRTLARKRSPSCSEPMLCHQAVCFSVADKRMCLCFSLCPCGVHGPHLYWKDADEAMLWDTAKLRRKLGISSHSFAETDIVIRGHKLPSTSSVEERERC